MVKENTAELIYEMPDVASVFAKAGGAAYVGTAWTGQVQQSTDVAEQAHEMHAAAKQNEVQQLQTQVSEAVESLQRMIDNVNIGTTERTKYEAIARQLGATASHETNPAALMALLQSVASLESQLDTHGVISWNSEGHDSPEEKELKLWNRIAEDNKKLTGIFGKMEEKGVVFGEEEKKRREELVQEQENLLKYLEQHPGDEETRRKLQENQKDLNAISNHMLEEAKIQGQDNPGITDLVNQGTKVEKDAEKAYAEDLTKSTLQNKNVAQANTKSDDLNLDGNDIAPATSNKNDAPLVNKATAANIVMSKDDLDLSAGDMPPSQPVGVKQTSVRSMS